MQHRLLLVLTFVVGGMVFLQIDQPDRGLKGQLVPGMFCADQDCATCECDPDVGNNCFDLESKCSDYGESMLGGSCQTGKVGGSCPPGTYDYGSGCYANEGTTCSEGCVEGGSGSCGGAGACNCNSATGGYHCEGSCIYDEECFEYAGEENCYATTQLCGNATGCDGGGSGADTSFCCEPEAGICTDSWEASCPDASVPTSEYACSETCGGGESPKWCCDTASTNGEACEQLAAVGESCLSGTNYDTQSACEAGTMCGGGGGSSTWRCDSGACSPTICNITDADCFAAEPACRLGCGGGNNNCGTVTATCTTTTVGEGATCGPTAECCLASGELGMSGTVCGTDLTCETGGNVSGTCVSTGTTCGDGDKEGDEECDDDNTDNNDGCSSSCKDEVCGDGIEQTSEECDDDNTVDGDGCSSSCEVESTCEACGDQCVDTPVTNCTVGFLCPDCPSPEEGFTCAFANDVCTKTIVPFCGDGNTDAGEECDDENDIDDDDCKNDCTEPDIPATCGNGAVEGIEQCDNGPNNSDVIAGACRTDCKNARCGDGVKDNGEECDYGKGNNAPASTATDGCTSACKAARGLCTVDSDCALDPGEDFLCLGPVDDDLEIVQYKKTEGDPDNIIYTVLAGDCYYEAAGCEKDACIAHKIFDCECPIADEPIICGDGDKEGSEECDDGNTIDDDGCDSACTWEYTCGICGENCTEFPVNNCQVGYSCMECDEPTEGLICEYVTDVCTDVTPEEEVIEEENLCGNGTIDAGEECDGLQRDACTGRDYCLDSCECGWADANICGLDSSICCEQGSSQRCCQQIADPMNDATLCWPIGQEPPREACDAIDPKFACSACFQDSDCRTAETCVDGTCSLMSAGDAWDTADSPDVFGSTIGHSVVVFNQKLWDVHQERDVIFSSNNVASGDGYTWQSESGIFSGAPSLDEFTHLVFDGKQWLIGGTDYSGAPRRTRDTWSSADGVIWEKHANALPTETDRHASVVFKNKMWIFGGAQGSTGASNAVYVSDNGTSWSNFGTLPVGISRAEAVVLGDNIVILGGTLEDGSISNAVYKSINGISWSEVGSNALAGKNFSNRTAAVFGDAIWIVGNNQNDNPTTFLSRDGGATWTSGPTPHGNVFNGTDLVALGDTLWLIGGYDNTSPSRADTVQLIGTTPRGSCNPNPFEPTYFCSEDGGTGGIRTPLTRDPIVCEVITPPDAGLVAGLIHHWNFDDGPESEDQIGDIDFVAITTGDTNLMPDMIEGISGNGARVYGSATAPQPSIASKLSADSVIQSVPFTLAFQLEPTTFSIDTMHISIAQGKYISIHQSNGIGLGLYDSATMDRVEYVTAQGPRNGNWNNVVIRVDPSTVLLTVNGVTESMNNPAPSWSTIDANFGFGGRAGNNGGIVGIDEVYIWDRFLTEEETASVANDELFEGRSCPTVVAVDDDDGATAGATSGDTSGATAGATSGDTSGATAGATSGDTSGATTGATSGDTSGATAGANAGGTSGTNGGTNGGGSLFPSGPANNPPGRGGFAKAVCGDGKKQGRESCDDGNNRSGDGCSSSCETESITVTNQPVVDSQQQVLRTVARENGCGNGLREKDEQCDDGNQINGDGCSELCKGELELLLQTGPVCGNGIKEGGEECDKGTENSDSKKNACREDCTNAQCGDFVLDNGEECDNGPANSDDKENACRTNCRLSSCGDNAIDSGEECDDGNTNNGDGCTSTCLEEGSLFAAASVCGDGALAPPEECDDANGRDGDGCSAVCQLEFGICGDGIVQQLLGEQCEESTHDSALGYGCRECALFSTSCGDGNVDPGETCDNGEQNSNAPGSACRVNCHMARCGDGILDPEEECDDGNRINSDGCDWGCKEETEDPSLVLGAQIDFGPDPSLQLPDAAPSTSPYSPGANSAYFPQYPTGQPLPYQLPLAQLRPLIQTQGPVGDTGPAAVAVVASGMAAGFGWIRRKKR